MFFSERIRQIRKSDLVLEIGPGSSPHWRSDVLLERQFDEEEASRQRGGTARLATSKKLVFYDGNRFPFDDHAFDYVICSHVIEHVDDVEAFCSEMFRVAKRGYLEYPTVYYEYLYNFSVHKQLVNLYSGELCYLPKIESGLQRFQPIHDLFYRSLELGYSDLVQDMKRVMFQGFEWTEPFKVRRAESILELASHDLKKLQAMSLMSRYLRRIFHKIF
jgi:SAM-dependent methyltransferase